VYTLIQQYGMDGHWDDPDGQRLPVPSLVEDQDGERAMLVGPLIPQQAWIDAVASGAVGLFRVLGAPLAYCPAEIFTSYRRENVFAAAFELPDDRWGPLDSVMPLRVIQAADELIKPESDNPFVHLHTHSEFSALDGLSTMGEIMRAITADGQQAVAITDHGVCAGHPALQKAATEHGIKPIFGIESYFVDDRSVREDQHDYRHLVLWAQDDEGLRNLWALSTEGYRDGFYGKPRIDWDSLTRHQSGLLVSTACLGGPLLEPYLQGNEERALQNLARLFEIFGERLFIEIHANHLEDQLKGNHWLVETARKYGVPLIAAVDSHYAVREDKDNHHTWLAMQTNKDVADDSDLFGGNQDYHLMGVDEVRHALSYLPADVIDEAIENTGKLAATCTAEIKPKIVMPVFSRATEEHPDPVAHDIERYADGALANWQERIIDRGIDPEQAEKDSLYEFDLMIGKGFPGYFLTTADFVCWAKDHGILVGPGRGSGAASRTAYLLRITEVDPIGGDLLLDRFMTPGRKSLPDFDIDFPTSKSDIMLNYIGERWGHEHYAQVGTHLRLKNKSAFKDVQRAIASRLPGDSFTIVNKISKIIDEAESSTAGLGLSWEDLMAQVGELLEPYKEQIPEVFELAERFRGRLKTYGRHAAGVIIDPDSNLYEELPMRAGEGDGPMVTQFDMEALEYLGKIKFDFLKLRNLDTIQAAIDLIRETTGDVINVYDWVDEYNDPQVYEDLAAGWTLGVFQIETNLGTRTTKQLQPRNLAELSDVITLGRPGPMRSGLDKLYMRRRSGEEALAYADPRLEKVLAKTWGVMIYQEDIMATCMILANYDADEADHVRKILGKKKIELVAAEGQRFIRRAIDNGTDPRVADEIWSQMAEFAKYSFNRAHAYSYATLAYWTAWLKTHYPREYLTASMATIDKDRIPQFVNEARRLGYEVVPPDINLSGKGFTSDGLVVRYGLESVNRVGSSAADAIIDGREAGPYTSFEDFLERKGPKCNMGHVAQLGRVGAFDSLFPNRRGLEYRLADDKSGESTKCQFKDETFENAHGLPCHFDWSSEPIKLGRTGKPLKVQPKPPKRCTKACRHYTPRDAVDYSGVPEYSDEEVRDIEHELLGVYLSSSPFDRIPPDVMNELITADDLMTAEIGVYMMAVIVASTRPDPQGRDFGFATFNTPAGDLSTIVFSRQWDKYKGLLTKGRMALASIHKTEQERYRLTHLEIV
jgi:DNA polymerase-3 subunit alpha